MSADTPLTDMDRAYLEYGRAAYDLFEQPSESPDEQVDARYLETKKRVTELRARAKVAGKGAHG
jgi:hypothetical protein